MAEPLSRSVPPPPPPPRGAPKQRVQGRAGGGEGAVGKAGKRDRDGSMANMRQAHLFKDLQSMVLNPSGDQQLSRALQTS